LIIGNLKNPLVILGFAESTNRPFLNGSPDPHLHDIKLSARDALALPAQSKEGEKPKEARDEKEK